MSLFCCGTELARAPGNPLISEGQRKRHRAPRREGGKETFRLRGSASVWAASGSGPWPGCADGRVRGPRYLLCPWWSPLSVRPPALMTRDSFSSSRRLSLAMVASRASSRWGQTHREALGHQPRPGRDCADTQRVTSSPQSLGREPTAAAKALAGISAPSAGGAPLSGSRSPLGRSERG